MTDRPTAHAARQSTHSEVPRDEVAGSARVGPKRGGWRTARRRRQIANLTFGAPAALLLAVLSVYPMWILVQMSISDVTIANILGYWPIIGLDNFRYIFNDGVFRGVALQTVVFVLVILIVTMVLGTLCALILKNNNTLARATQTIMILVWTLPPVIIGSLWKFLLASDGTVSTALRRLGLTDRPIPFLSQPVTSLAAIIVVSLWVGVPFAALVIKSAMLDIPPDLLEAARVDGASPARVFLLIILPIIRPTFLILSVLSVVGAFKAFDFIYVMTSGGPGTSSSTIPFLGYLTAFQSYQFGRASAISVVAMVIVLALAIAYIVAIRKEEQDR